jgi:histidinol-phosphate aminotransferase
VAYSDYKDDGKNILLDANENAFGPGLKLGEQRSLSTAAPNGAGGAPAIDVDLLGLNRYPDPYVCPSRLAT